MITNYLSTRGIKGVFDLLFSYYNRLNKRYTETASDTDNNSASQKIENARRQIQLLNHRVMEEAISL